MSGLQQATELVLSNYISVDPQRRQWTCVDLYQVKMRLEEYKTAAVTLGFGLDNLELIMVEIGSISFCLLFQGDFIFHIKSGNDHCLKLAGREFFHLYQNGFELFRVLFRGIKKVWETLLVPWSGICSYYLTFTLLCNKLCLYKWYICSAFMWVCYFCARDVLALSNSPEMNNRNSLKSFKEALAFLFHLSCLLWLWPLSQILASHVTLNSPLPTGHLLKCTC